MTAGAVAAGAAVGVVALAATAAATARANCCCGLGVFGWLLLLPPLPLLLLQRLPRLGLLWLVLGLLLLLLATGDEEAATAAIAGDVDDGWILATTFGDVVATAAAARLAAALRETRLAGRVEAGVLCGSLGLDMVGRGGAAVFLLSFFSKRAVSLGGVDSVGAVPAFFLWNIQW